MQCLPAYNTFAMLLSREGAVVRQLQLRLPENSRHTRYSALHHKVQT